MRRRVPEVSDRLSRVSTPELRADELQPRPVRRRAAAFPTAGPENRYARGRRGAAELGREPALADAGVAGEEAEPAVPVHRRTQRGVQLRKLACAVDEGA